MSHILSMVEVLLEAMRLEEARSTLEEAERLLPADDPRLKQLRDRLRKP